MILLVSSLAKVCIILAKEASLACKHYFVLCQCLCYKRELIDVILAFLWCEFNSNFKGILKYYTFIAGM